MREAIFEKHLFAFFSLAHAIMEGEGLMSYTAASHQGAIQMY